MAEALSRQELEAAHCWEADDRVPGRPEMTEFRRRLRYHQTRWREANGHPIGSQPIAPRPDGGPVRLLGSRLPLAYARETGANFLTAGALDAARARTSFIEPHQSFDHQRLWADLLWSPTIAFNLFGDVTAYHDVNRPQPPKPSRLPRYREITETSGIFGPGAIDAVNGTELIHIWLDHLLVLSMLQHPSRAWRWGRLVVVHPVGNSDFAGACTRYSDLLLDWSTFSSVTLEELLDADALPPQTAAALGDRYVLR